MRTKKRVQRPLNPDPVYNDLMVSKFINHIMRNGKKSIAQKIVYKAFDEIKKKTKNEPLEVFKKAIENATPYVEVVSRRIGGATYQVPKEVDEIRGISLAMRWIIASAKSQKGKPMYQKLADEIISAYKNEGGAIKRKQELQKIAEANRAFAHLL